MSTVAKITQPRRPRREFDDEFKGGAVRLVLDEGQSVGRVAHELDLTESAFRNWGPSSPGRSDEGPDGLDERGTRGAAAAPQREPAVAGGA